MLDMWLENNDDSDCNDDMDYDDWCEMLDRSFIKSFKRERDNEGENV